MAWKLCLFLAISCRLINAVPPPSFDLTKNSQQLLVAGKPFTDEELRTAKLTEREDREWNAEFINFAVVHSASSERNGINFVKWPKWKWPNGEIPYIMTTNFTLESRERIAWAMKQFHDHTCIRFIPRTDQASYIMIVLERDNIASSSGRVGKNGYYDDYQLLKLNLQITTWESLRGGLLHEIMHPVGFYHEHTRPDRDQFIFVNESNIKPEWMGQYEKMPSDDVNIKGLDYDYKSVMHYKAYEYFLAVDPNLPIMIPLKEGMKLEDLGGSNYFTELDVKKINALYDCQVQDNGI